MDVEGPKNNVVGCALDAFTDPLAVCRELLLKLPAIASGDPECIAMTTASVLCAANAFCELCPPLRRFLVAQQAVIGTLLQQPQMLGVQQALDFLLCLTLTKKDSSSIPWSCGILPVVIESLPLDRILDLPADQRNERHWVHSFWLLRDLLEGTCSSQDWKSQQAACVWAMLKSEQSGLRRVLLSDCKTAALHLLALLATIVGASSDAACVEEIRKLLVESEGLEQLRQRTTRDVSACGSCVTHICSIMDEVADTAAEVDELCAMLQPLSLAVDSDGVIVPMQGRSWATYSASQQEKLVQALLLGGQASEEVLGALGRAAQREQKCIGFYEFFSRHTALVRKLFNSPSPSIRMEFIRLLTTLVRQSRQLFFGAGWCSVKLGPLVIKHLDIRGAFVCGGTVAAEVLLFFAELIATSGDAELAVSLWRKVNDSNVRFAALLAAEDLFVCTSTLSFLWMVARISSLQKIAQSGLECFREACCQGAKSSRGEYEMARDGQQGAYFTASCVEQIRELEQLAAGAEVHVTRPLQAIKVAVRPAKKNQRPTWR